MKPINPSSPALQDIVVARCESLAEAQAMTRWLLPVLQEWPHPAWHLWIADATNTEALQAAKIAADGQSQAWQPVERDPAAPHDSLCALLGGHFGLVVFGHHLIAAEALRSLDGLVSHITSFPASDPLAKPFAKSLAAYGIRLAA